MFQRFLPHMQEEGRLQRGQEGFQCTGFAGSPQSSSITHYVQIHFSLAVCFPFNLSRERFSSGSVGLSSGRLQAMGSVAWLRVFCSALADLPFVIVVLAPT